MNNMIEDLFGPNAGKYGCICICVIAVCIAAYKITELLIVGGGCTP